MNLNATPHSARGAGAALAGLPLSNRGVEKTTPRQDELARVAGSERRTWAGIDWCAGSVDLFDVLEQRGFDPGDDWRSPGISELLESFGPRSRRKGDEADANGELVTGKSTSVFVQPPPLVEEIAREAFAYLFGGSGLVLAKEARPGKFYAFRWMVTNVFDQPAGMVELGGQLTLRKGGRPSLRFELTGLGSAIYENRADASADHAQQWCAFAAQLQRVRGQLSRVDVAFDDFDGVRNLALARTMWEVGEFDYTFAGERHRPQRREMLASNNKGETLYVGNSSSEKQLRVYEKGKQLGDQESPWVRWELQLRSSTRRQLALAILGDPLAYMRGAFACLDWVSSCIERLQVTREATKACVKSVMRHAKRMFGATYRQLHRMAPDEAQLHQLMEFLGDEKLPRWAKTGRVGWDDVRALLAVPPQQESIQ